MGEHVGRLVLGFDPGQAFWIGNDVRVVYVGKGRGRNRALFAIEAPRSIEIVRENLIASEIVDVEDGT